MRRSPLTLEEVADWHNLASAFQRAARGKGNRDEVRSFAADLSGELARLHREILNGSIEVGRMRSFAIHDPKPRLIHAPCFRERVLHHALLAHIGPLLDRALVDDTYASRVGKGTLAAVRRARHHLQRHPWFAQIDIRGCFATIDHGVLRGLLARQFKNPGLLLLLARIVDAHHTTPGKGLPIGAFTSQCFANFYLAGLDRLLLEECRVGGMVRYMDDIAWWGEEREQVRTVLGRVRLFAQESLRLELKQPSRVGRSEHGLTFCGFRILPDRLLLSRRRKRRYGQFRRRWEESCAAGNIDVRTLQAGFAGVLAPTLHADAKVWRAEQLRRHPVADAGWAW